MYLACFEQIVAATVVGLGGPDWALPYWNYSDLSNANARRLTPAFRAERTPDNVANPLRVDDRRPGCNDGDVIADDLDVALDCLTEPSFVAAPTGGNPGFGGPKTRFNHSGGVVGMLEATPHGSMHGAVNGWMGAFHTAGLDPIFWLHHANIDRLWAVWRARNASHIDPTDPQWKTGVAFEFNGAGGSIVTFTSDQVVETTAAPLLYEYEDVSDPFGGAAPEIESARSPSMEDRPIPEMVGATEGPVVLTERPTSTRLSISAPTGPARTSNEARAVPLRVFLNFENIVGSGPPTSYSVYLNLPEGADPEQHPELLAGRLPMFGVAEASRADQEHPGSGLHYALEISHLLRRLEGPDPRGSGELRVTFVPRLQSLGPQGALETIPHPIEVGRVSLYYQ
jgi:tyrosinase